MLQALREHEGREHQRRHQQGLGRPIISGEFKGHRIVAVGNKLFWSKNWKTFHDFLFEYIRKVFGGEWGNAELKKDFAHRHPLLQWYDHVCKQQAKHLSGDGSVSDMPMTGGSNAYLGLAYNLYLLAHNVELQERFLQRLRNAQQFYAAYYEVFVAAAFIKAGFRLELENEQDGDSTHCEFTAIHDQSGRKYSVEAKARYQTEAEKSQGAAPKLQVHNQLYKALKKKADHERVVFIDLNVPSIRGEDGPFARMNEALSTIREKEKTLTIDGMEAPPAYVFVTNYPYHHILETDDLEWATLLEGFKIPDLKYSNEVVPLKAALDNREKYKVITSVLETFRNTQIPVTFDGELPEFAFRAAQDRRLVIGRKYDFASEGETPMIGEVTDAIVMEATKEICAGVTLDDGRSVLMRGPISERELAAYRESPDTYFGVHRMVGRQSDDPLQLYDFMMRTYSKTPKEKLLEFMKDHPDVAALRTLGQAELASIYCERMTYAVVSHDKSNRGKSGSE